jgi:four helix bundle protein
MGVHRLEDLAAFQLAIDFKLEVYRLIRESPEAKADWRYRAQLSDAASSVESCVTEGWHRYRAGAMIPFLVYSRASLAEAERWLHDGVDRGYFSRSAIDAALTTAGRCGAALTNLRKSLQPFAQKKRRT